MLERDGKLLASTASTRPNDARLRRAQALAGRSELGVRIARELITRKLAGQEQIARERLRKAAAADMINGFRAELAAAKEVASLRLIESQAAAAYWASWRSLPITFPKRDLSRVPDHWLSFDARISPLTGSPRLAANPVNAILNYLYALLESEARFAATAMGLDPGLGILHLDTKARASLACDLMEPVRPQVDEFVLDWITRTALKREWFFEQRDGNCRLMAPLAVQLSETISMWRRAVAPHAEWVARELWSTIKRATREAPPATRLTQDRKREAKGQPVDHPAVMVVRPEGVCRECGKSVPSKRGLCGSCAIPAAGERLKQAQVSGRIAAHSLVARARQSETQRRNAAARANWDPSSQPPWLNEETYLQAIQPLLGRVATSAISTTLGVSWVYAKEIRIGKSRPHPRHWQTLAQLVGATAGSNMPR